MKIVIDLPNKTIAHIRSDYGHKYFGCIGDDDKKIIMKAIYDGTPLEEELKTIRVKITACTAQGEGNFCDIHNNAIEMARKVVDNRISELKGEKNDTTN